MEWVSRFRRTLDEPHSLPATPDEAVRRLLDGNAQFVRTVASPMPPTDPATFTTPPAAPRQVPFGVILGCSDARAPAELVFEAGPNELFVVRVAGNSLGDESLGSIEYALHNFRNSLRLLVVLGHTGCGAVTAAVDAYLAPTRPSGTAFTRSLRAVINHALIAVRGGAMALDEFWGPEAAADPGYRDALIQVSVYLNAGMTAAHLREEVRPEEGYGVRVMYGVLDLATWRVVGPEMDPNTDGDSNLTMAPAHPGELVALGRQIAATPMVARYLSASLRQTRYPV